MPTTVDMSDGGRFVPFLLCDTIVEAVYIDGVARFDA